MTVPSRRRMVAGTFTAGVAGLVGAGLKPAPAAAADTPPAAGAARTPGAADITPGDPRYEELATRGVNKRFTARPAAFRVATTTDEVVRAVGEAARSGRRVAVRSGGHCYENFVGDPAVRLVIDLGEMNAVSYDPRKRAFMVEAGARLMDVYRKLHDVWGVTLPGGASATVGMGGHVAGGGYGALSRRFGVAADHLYAVEVVVADAHGRARAVVATREPSDPHRELWWAHAGGGGGNFGVVTRYWFRSPGATGDDPGGLLPRPPATTVSNAVLYPREGMDRAAFRRLVRNFGLWHERNSGADSPYAGLYGGLVLLSRLKENDPGQSAVSFAHVDGDRPDAERLLKRYVAAVTEGVGVTPHITEVARDPWLTATAALAESQDHEKGRQKIKSAYLRRAFTDHQADALYRHLNSGDHSSEAAHVSLQSFGGRINSLRSSATAYAHRQAVINVIFMNVWQDERADAENVGWLRHLYRDVFAATGGVPVPGRNSDGCYVNYPDLDMADADWNTSGVPWHRLYYKDNYPRLQRIKAIWDPCGVFGHALGVRPA
ncbi:FAD-binding oxidoreductase [Streptomyces afghaniensis]|uniref:FAD-binding oxidoreductase n=1 Tax=Streptomyces afghaniensis TaxID=66865 RepID=UPI002787E56D|nr:FAD-binding protein [Streptomyces afghaniensis]MDQ1016537.1 FAD/FMN-containing dehydrogenase [Streptomyces afghaniensis]